jgi:hypothetical protein
MTFYGIILTTHIATAISLLLLMVYADHTALRWFLGRTQTLSAKITKRLHLLVYSGLSIMLCTGLYMFWPLQSYLLSLPAFQIKMTFVIALLLNSVFISSHMHLATQNCFTDLLVKQKLTLLLSGGLSFIAWVGAAVAATQLGL